MIARTRKNVLNSMPCRMGLALIGIDWYKLLRPDGNVLDRLRCVPPAEGWGGVNPRHQLLCATALSQAETSDCPASLHNSTTASSKTYSCCIVAFSRTTAPSHGIPAVTCGMQILVHVMSRKRIREAPSSPHCCRSDMGHAYRVWSHQSLGPGLGWGEPMYGLEVGTCASPEVTSTVNISTTTKVRCMLYGTEPYGHGR
jgi:hypothetical protein